MILVPGGVAGHGIWLVWYGTSTAYTSGTATVTTGAANTQLWQFPSSVQGGYTMWAQVYGRRTVVPAAFTSDLPPGMQGIYGLGGATAATLLDAYPQWSRIPSNSTVIQVGTNDFQGSVTVATFVSQVQDIVNRRLALGDRYVAWLTITPRDTDTATIRKRKAQAAQLLYDWALTMSGRFHVLDIAAPLTDQAAGASQGKYITNASNDGIHLQHMGAMLAGKVIGDFDRKLTQMQPYWGSVGDVYDATENLYGNILPAVSAGSGWMEGTTGTITAPTITVAAWAGTTAYVVGQPVISAGNLYICATAGTTGAAAPIHTAGLALDGTVVWLFSAAGAVTGVATGWTLSRVTGDGIVACCKVLRIDGVPGYWQRLISYAATTTSAYRLITSASGTGFTVAAKYTLDSEIRHISSTNLNCLGNQITINGTSGAKVPQCGIVGTSSTYYHADTTADPNEAFILGTPPDWLTVAASSTLAAALHVGNRGSGFAVFDFGRQRLRRVA